MMKIIKNKKEEIRPVFKIIVILLLKALLEFSFLSSGVKILGTSIINYIILSIILIFITIVLWKAFERRSINEMGVTNIKKSYRELIIGIVIGTFTISLIECILIVFDVAQIVEPLVKQNLLLIVGRGILISIFIAVSSEMIYRGYIMSVLKNTNKYLVLVFSAVIEVSPILLITNIDKLLFINCMLISLLLAYMFIKSKSIWLPIGFDFSWNFIKIYVYGFKDGGMESGGIYQLQNIGDNLLNGGYIGPQAGLAATIIICLVFVFIYFYYIK